METNDVPPFAAPPPINPPPVIQSPLPVRPRKSRGWMIVALVLLVLLVLSLFGNFSQWLSGLGGLMPMQAMHSGSAPASRLEEFEIEDNDSANKIVVVDVSGIITSSLEDQGGLTMVDRIKEELKRAREDNRVKAVVLRVDSPGGEVLASDEIYGLLREFQAGKGAKPVITSMGNLAASGGYYIAAASRWIVANEMTITGSIGVIMHSYNYRGLMDKIGLQPDVYKSGAHKDMLSGERLPSEIPAEEREMVQALIDETYGRFKLVVEEGRKAAHDRNQNNAEGKGRALADDWKNFADGRVLSGKRAAELGFVDEVGNFDKAVKRAKELAHIKNANLVEYKLRYELSDFFRMFGRTEAPAIKLDLGMPGAKVAPGHLYFLLPLALH